MIQDTRTSLRVKRVSQSTTMLLLIGLALLVVGRVECFTTRATTGGSIFRRSPFVLEASRSVSPPSARATKRKTTIASNGRSSVMAQPVQPKTSISASKRKKAKLAMQQQENQQRVDAQMLQLLSEQFLYAEAPQVPEGDRPNGRPACVPGAMNYETVIQYRKRQRDQQKNRSSTTVTVPYQSSGSSNNNLLNNDKWSLEGPTTQQPVKKRGRGRPKKTNVVANGAKQKLVTKNTTTKMSKPLSVRKKSIKGARKSKNTTMTATPGKSSKKQRKKVVKNLPKPRSKPEKEQDKKNRIAVGGGGDPLNLQRYYRTELLAAQEEYGLGMKIQFMMQCEHVHEGLATSMGRLPTMEEWAVACGFDTPDPTFIAKEGDEQIRPAGSGSMFDVVDPNTFVGNGLANNAGPGRGRGRVKKPPPLTLGDYVDDTEIRFAKKGNKTPKSIEDLQPINRGTPLDFIEAMMDSKVAKQRMVQCNMRLVVSIARKYSNVGVSLPDLVQEGSLGLARAAEKFEPSKGFKFSTYASWWIQQAVFRSIAYHSRTIRLPVHVHNLLNRVRRIKVSLEQDLGRTPTNEEVAEQLDMTVQKYNKMLSLTRRSISLEVPKYQSNPKDFGHESEDLLGETIDANAVLLDENNPEKRVDRGLFQQDLREMLKILEEDERRVISARYGLDDGLTRTVTAVAAQLKQTKAWVRSQECRALRKLRRPWYETRLREHQNSLTS